MLHIEKIINERFLGFFIYYAQNSILFSNLSTISKCFVHNLKSIYKLAELA